MPNRMPLQNKLDKKMWPADDKPKNVRDCKDSTVGKQSTERTGNIYKNPSIAHNKSADVNGVTRHKVSIFQENITG